MIAEDEALQILEGEVLPDELDGLTWRQKQFLACRLLSDYDKEAAEKAGVALRTVQSWKLEDAEFREAYNALGSGGLELASRMIADLMGEAAAELRRLMSSDRDSVRLKAAELVLTLGGMSRGVDVNISSTEQRLSGHLEALRRLADE